MPLRPYLVRSVAVATRTSPSRTAVMKLMSAPAATVTGPSLLQAQANAVSASMNTNPPWQIEWPFSICIAIRIWTMAVPRPTCVSSMPSPRDAWSAANIAAAGPRGGSRSPGSPNIRPVPAYATPLLGRCRRRPRPCASPRNPSDNRSSGFVTVLIMTSFRQPGTVLTDRTFPVPLDHANPGGEHIEVFAREVAAADAKSAELPWLLFLQGGPGFGSPRPI